VSRLPLAVGLASAAVIAFQLVIMQLLAIAQWHHFAYMVISMALLGFGAAGTVLALFRPSFERHYVALLPALFAGCALAMASTAWLVGLAGEFDAFLLFFDRGQVGLLVFSYLAWSLPFFFAGLAITLAFHCELYRIGALYCANMAGSGAGAVLVIGLLWLVPAERLAGLLALLPLVAAWLTRPADRTTGPQAAAGLAALAAAIASIAWPAMPAPSQYKDISAALLLPGAAVTHTGTSPYGRLEVVRAEALRFAPSLSLNFRGEPPVRPVLYNDGDYLGTLLGRGLASDGHILDHSTRALPYALRAPGSVLVLQAGTGTEVSLALARGAEHIVAVEPHRQLKRLLRDDHPEWIDGLYRDPRVSLHGLSPRAWLARPPAAEVDLVVLPVLGSFGGTSGEQALREYYHLTLQAFDRMWELLSEDGLIAVTLWQEEPPRAVLKLLASWRTLLAHRVAGDALEYIVAVRSWGTTTLLLGKRPFDASDHERLRAFAAERGFDPLVLAGLEPGERDRYNRVTDPILFTAIDALLSSDAKTFKRNYPFDLRPATDDRPFFERFMQWHSLAELREIYGLRQLPYLELGFVLAGVTLVQIALAAVVLIVAPLARIGWQGTRRRWTLVYFSSLGLGFMCLEIVLIHRMMLYFDQPVYAAGAVLATLLVASGGGSLASVRLAADGRSLRGIGLVVAGLVLLYALALAPLLSASMAWPLAAKALAAALVLAPPAFFMGMLFPLGLRRLAGSEHRQVPWACAIDSCLSVAATAIATVIALDAGFRAVMVLAALAYLVAAASGPRLGKLEVGEAIGENPRL
jgi:hypothetical protein